MHVNFEKYSIEQTYINIDDAKDYFSKLLNLSNKQVEIIDTARIRKLTTQNVTKYFLCGKTKGLEARQEYEKQIDEKLASSILQKRTLGKVFKNRYVVFYEGYKFEFDNYTDRNLTVCEIEVNPSNDNLKQIEQILTSHFKLKIKNITNDQNFKNANLAK